jgi:exopolyphosphatase/guanosine-5'-triphosphate,3'-diphosphate pyrophosphatase
LSPATVIPSTGTVRALIDIGTNSVKLLVASVRGRNVTPLHEESEQTRLGRGFYETHLLQPDAIHGTALAVARFAALAADAGAVNIRVIATSAARDARNQQELLDTVRRVTGLRIEVISGDQEAQWVYQGVTSDPALAGHRLLILDVGGGSTEFILGQGDHKRFCQSFPLGSVRLLERLHPADPPSPADLARARDEVAAFVRTQVMLQVEGALQTSSEPCRLVGTGGASTIMGRILRHLDRFDRDLLEGAVISLAEVQALVSRLWGMALVERRHIIGLPKKRADVILTGSVIYEGVMEQLGFTELHISTRGLRFGGLADA